jgi:hypothetical protein
MLIYRVEHATLKLGPYRQSKFMDCVMHNYHTPRYGRGVSTRWLFGMTNRRAYKFGFKSLACLLLWFEGSIETLHENGFCIRSYYVPKKYVVEDYNQLIYLIIKARPVERLNLLEMQKNVHGPIDNPGMARIICIEQPTGEKVYEAIYHKA